MLPIILAVVILCLVPFAPTLLRVRIRVLQAIHFPALAAFHERHFNGIVLVVRVALLAVAGILLWISLTGGM